jgi:ATP-dependent exoDNAse (exonuclease V) beta subunit
MQNLKLVIVLCMSVLILRTSSFLVLPRILNRRILHQVLHATESNSISIPNDFGQGFIAPHVPLEFRKLEKKNPHNLDKIINFEPVSHTYTLNGIPIKSSVTSIVEQFFEKFNGKLAIQRMMNGNNWPRSEYMLTDLSRPMNEKEILAQWDSIGMEARNLGTWMHYNIELFINGNSPTASSPELVRFLKFYSDIIQNKIFPYRTEWRIGCSETMIAGTVDFVGQKLDGSYVLMDWKRSKKLNGNPISSYGKKAKYPLNELDDCDTTKYSLQLNLYRYILQKHYNMKIDSMIVVSFHPILKSYYAYNVPIMDEAIRKILNEISRSKSS